MQIIRHLTLIRHNQSLEAHGESVLSRKGRLPLVGVLGHFEVIEHHAGVSIEFPGLFRDVGTAL